MLDSFKVLKSLYLAKIVLLFTKRINKKITNLCDQRDKSP